VEAQQADEGLLERLTARELDHETAASAPPAAAPAGADLTGELKKRKTLQDPIARAG
jgi:hypothetical protein